LAVRERQPALTFGTQEAALHLCRFDEKSLVEFCLLESNWLEEPEAPGHFAVLLALARLVTDTLEQEAKVRGVYLQLFVKAGAKHLAVTERISPRSGGKTRVGGASERLVLGCRQRRPVAVEPIGQVRLVVTTASRRIGSVERFDHRQELVHAEKLVG